MARRRSFGHWLLTSRVTIVGLYFIVALMGVVPIILYGESLEPDDAGLFVRLSCAIGTGVWIFYSRSMADGILTFARMRYLKTE